MTPEPCVFIVDDDAAVRDALQLLVRSVGLKAETYGSAVEFLDVYDPARAGCLVLDVRMPGTSGLELQRRLADMESTLPIIFVTAHGDIPMAVQAVKAGAVDFIQKPFRDQELLDKIQSALEQHQGALATRADRSEIETCLTALTAREREVMELVVLGKANKVIAAELGISQRTVEIHRARVMQKMRADSLSDLVRMVMQIDGGA